MGVVKERQEESLTQTMVIQWSEGDGGYTKAVPPRGTISEADTMYGGINFTKTIQLVTKINKPVTIICSRRAEVYQYPGVQHYMI